MRGMLMRLFGWIPLPWFNRESSDEVVAQKALPGYRVNANPGTTLDEEEYYEEDSHQQLKKLEQELDSLFLEFEKKGAEKYHATADVLSPDKKARLGWVHYEGKWGLWGLFVATGKPYYHISECDLESKRGCAAMLPKLAAAMRNARAVELQSIGASIQAAKSASEML